MLKVLLTSEYYKQILIHVAEMGLTTLAPAANGLKMDNTSTKISIGTNKHFCW